MPKVTVYIRNEDYEKWKAIEEKTEFIHGALKNGTASGADKEYSRPTRAAEKLPTTEEQIESIAKAQSKFMKTDSSGRIISDRGSCKHGADPKLCRFAKAGKPCK
jgi:hypothetical protein